MVRITHSWHRRVVAAGVLVALVVGLMLTGRSALGLAQEKTEIEFASWQWLEPGTGDVWKKLSSEFSASNPGVTVKDVAVPFPRYEETMLVRLTGGQAPDVLMANTFMFFGYQGRDQLQPLDGLIPIAKYRSDFHPGSAVANIKGQTYGLMVQWNPYALLYNAKTFRDAGLSVPKTTAEFFSTALKLTKPPAMYGYGTRHGLSEEAGWWFELSYWVYAFGGRWSAGGKPTTNSPHVLEGIRFFKRMYDGYLFPRGVDAATYRRMFAEQKVAMLTDVPALWVITKNLNPSIDLAVAKNPFAPNPPVTLGANVFLTIPKDAKHPKQAAAMIDWMYQHMTELGEGLGTIMGSKRANVAVFKKFPYLQTYAEMPVVEGGGLVPPGFESAFGEFRHIVLSHVSAILSENRDVDKEMSAAQTELDDLAKKIKR
jgi:multiple sugar transport system substrate-binding protein